MLNRSRKSAALFFLLLLGLTDGASGYRKAYELPAIAVSVKTIHTEANTTSIRREEINEKYRQWNLSQAGIREDVFMSALTGHEALNRKGALRRSHLLTIVDFSKPSSVPRLFVLNLESGELLFKTLVAHGMNSGKLMANSFSNSESSHESSPGFYVTDDTYYGKNGYSLKLIGCEKGFNDNAYRRSIVVHGADYVSESFVRKNGFLGRSHGCPAIPSGISREIINLIKDGTCLFIYFPSQKYLCASRLLDGER